MAAHGLHPGRVKARIYRHQNGTLYLGVQLTDGSIDYTMCDDVISLINNTLPENLRPVSTEFKIERGAQ